MEQAAKKRKIRQDSNDSSSVCLRVTGIADLPNEIISKIFGYLDVVRKYKNRRVCKRWYPLLISPPVLRDMLVDRLFFMTDELRARFIKFEQCVQRAVSPALTHLHLAAVADTRYVPCTFAFGGDSLLNPAICERICDPVDGAVQLRVISLENGCVSVAHLKLLLDHRPNSLRKVTFRDVMVQDLCTMPRNTVSAGYSYDLFVAKESIEVPGQTLFWNFEKAIWSLMEVVCPVLTEKRRKRLQQAINDLTDEGQHGVVLDVVRKRQPAVINRISGTWSKNVMDLNPLTQTDLEALLASIRHPFP